MSLYGPDTLFQVVITVYNRPEQNIGFQVLGISGNPPLIKVLETLNACTKMLIHQVATPQPQGEPVCPAPTPS